MAVSLPKLLGLTARDWSNDNVPRLSAALACYAVFSISPMLIVVLNLAGAFFGPDAVRGQLDSQLQGLMGAKAAAVIQDMIRSTVHADQGLFATISASILLFFGATSLFAEMHDALYQIWNKDPNTKPPSGWFLWLRSRLLACGIVLIILLLLTVSLLTASAFSFISTHMPAHYVPPAMTWMILGFAVSFVGELCLFAILFKSAPGSTCTWRHVWGGAAVTALLFEAGKWLLGWYLGRESTVSLYGAAGSLVLVLLWIYYSSMIVLTGAELTHSYTRLSKRADQPT